MHYVVLGEHSAEVCPTSNLHTKAVEGIKEFEHIVRTFWDRGVKITFNTDGPYLLETDMRKEIELVESNRNELAIFTTPRTGRSGTSAAGLGPRRWSLALG